MPVYYDITYPLNAALRLWPNDTPFEIERIKEAGDTSRSTVSRIQLSSHAGTHVDAPMHFLPGGGTVEGLDLSVLVGEAWVAEIEGAAISAEALKALSLPQDIERLIFKTTNSARFSGTEPFFEDYVGVTSSGAAWLVDRGVRLVGIDYLSVAAHADILDVHRRLLGASTVLLETLDLHAVQPGRYQLLCLPLKLDGADGAPARAVLVDI